jgi:hypothetical protein
MILAIALTSLLWAALVVATWRMSRPRVPDVIEEPPGSQWFRVSTLTEEESAHVRALSGWDDG